MESTGAPNPGAHLQFCGVVTAGPSSADDAGRSSVFRAALLVVYWTFPRPHAVLYLQHSLCYR
jgi:hypothetical protein